MQAIRATSTSSACRPAPSQPPILAPSLINNLVLPLAAVGCVMLSPMQAHAEISTSACTNSSCVSTSSFMKPSQYLAPWIYAPTTRQAAQQQLLRELEQLGAELTESDQQEGLFQARISYFTAGQEEQDLASFRFLDDPPEVLFKSEAKAGAELPGPTSPPFCFTRGCISGPRQRARLMALQDKLGWSGAETDEDKTWVQILLH